MLQKCGFMYCSVLVLNLVYRQNGRTCPNIKMPKEYSNWRERKEEEAGVRKLRNWFRIRTLDGYNNLVTAVGPIVVF